MDEFVSLSQPLIKPQKNHSFFKTYFIYFASLAFLLFIFGVVLFLGTQKSPESTVNAPQFQAEKKQGQLSMWGSSSPIFTFYKDNEKRQGLWCTCSEQGACGIVTLFPSGYPHFQWERPSTQNGGYVILAQRPTGRILPERKLKFFRPSNKWQEADGLQFGIAVVSGVDKHFYNLPQRAIQLLSELPDIQLSSDWQNTLRPFLSSTFVPVLQQIKKESQNIDDPHGQ